MVQLGTDRHMPFRTITHLTGPKGSPYNQVSFCCPFSINELVKNENRIIMLHICIVAFGDEPQNTRRTLTDCHINRTKRDNCGINLAEFMELFTEKTGTGGHECVARVEKRVSPCLHTYIL